MENNYKTFLQDGGGDEDEERNERNERNEKYSIKRAFRFIPLLLLLIVSVAYVSHRNNGFMTSSVKNEEMDFQSEETVPSIPNFTFKRKGYLALDYFDTSADVALKYEHLSSYIAVIEPNVEMEFKLNGITSSDSEYSYSFKFKLCKDGYSKSDCVEGERAYDPITSSASSTSFTMVCLPGEHLYVELTEYDSNSDLLGEYKVKAICSYVRREIRSLLEDDRNALLTAMHKLWELTDEEGIELYGKNFHSVSFLLKYHQHNAGGQHSDVIHDGNGVLLQHVKFTNLFENSLQSVDPSVALPYWDFTIDDTQGSTYTNDMLSPFYFGSSQTPAHTDKGYDYEVDTIEDGRIRDGLWADAQCPKYSSRDSASGFSEYGYGYIRGPWNLNPSPYIARYPFDFGKYSTLTLGRIPTCDSHYTLLKTDELMLFFRTSELDPHGGAHQAIGGFYGCNLLKPLLAKGLIADEATMHLVCMLWSPLMKKLWRHGYIEPEQNCEVNEEDLTLSECSYICNEEDKDAIFTYLNDYFYQDLKFTEPSEQDFDASVVAWTDFICGGDGSRIFVGDNYDSSSPKDPTFWVLHPTIERLLQARLIVGGFENEDWDTESACFFDNCLNDEGVFDKYDDCCYGHYEYDRMRDAALDGGFYGPTNLETLRATDPRGGKYSMPYLYDKFEWDHCKEMDSSLDFDALLQDIKESM